MADFIFLYRNSEADAREYMGTPQAAQESMKLWMAWLQDLETKGHLKSRGEPLERTENLLVFHTSGLSCAFPLEAVREIVPMARLSSPPGLPSGLEGFLDLRGIAVPIVRLDRLFDLPAQHPACIRR